MDRCLDCYTSSCRNHRPPCNCECHIKYEALNNNREATRYVVGRQEPDGTYTYIKGSHGQRKTETKLLDEATVYTRRGAGSAAHNVCVKGSFNVIPVKMKLV